MAEPFYITTAINYPNGRPHIGHAYEAIAADAIARFQRLMGRDVRFQTGTDEHGLKMVQTARDRGVPVRALADEMSGYFQEMRDQLNISCDRFIRTTDADHYAASQAIWRAMADAGDLYLARYEGWYSVRDEAFYDEKELVDGEGGKLSPQGTPVEWTAEESWFFRLSKYQQPLLDHYAAHPEFIQPESRRNEVLRFVEGGLSDLSVSRTSFDWGVPVPGSPGHVMYVWVDALTNYLTGTGYPGWDNELKRFWPADLHLIGKDIVRFHTVYWPAFLMSAKLPLPSRVFGHGFVLARDGAKMSKSAGNVADPLALAEAFGVDALRYFLLRDISFGQDGTWSEEAIVARANADLANSFGNLAQRTLSQIFKNCDGYLPAIHGHSPADAALFETIDRAVRGTIPNAFQELALSQATEAWIQAVFACNAYIDERAPWALRKTDPQRMETVLATLYICIAQLAVSISPVIPASAAKLLDAMGIAPELRTIEAIGGHWYSPLAESGFRLSQPVALFPRLDPPAA
ncbi:MAG: methionine--tRNA ligase [Sphingomonas sp.]|uniref:methionine--tRNA ligase n=1 Tax=Sphingomonas sp. TaxID=28214 RepID=UPI0025EBC069|nr:methionine--tRNA ligase [Sphingomonas sp.]MBX9882058.1 methionine--tRNA ligase [Sphingomonas sp.]